MTGAVSATGGTGADKITGGSGHNIPRLSGNPEKPLTNQFRGDSGLRMIRPRFAYGTNIALADALVEKEVSALLTETLEEEKQTDHSLTKITQQSIMRDAMGGSESGASRRGQSRTRQAAE